jgi:hypothetical protein
MIWLAYRNWHSGQFVEVRSHIGSSKKVQQLVDLPDQLVTVQHMAINTHEKQFFYTTHIYNGHGLITMCHTSKDQPAPICGQKIKETDA